jgi:uncharacterized BrkB/YihY/UPF0761 family membrane protein
MTSTGEIGRKFSKRMSSDGIIEERFPSIILFMGKFLALFVFMLGKQLFRFILQKFDKSPLFGRRATPLTLFY